MKRILSFLSLFVLLSGGLFAQKFPATGESAKCTNCVPSQSYSVISGTPDVSDTAFYGGTQLRWKDPSGNNNVSVPAPPSAYFSSAPNHITRTFLTLTSGPNIDSKVKFNASNFIPGQKYKLHYAVMATRLFSSTFGSEAVLEIETPNNPNNIFGAITDLSLAKNQWKEMVAEFTATEETLTFILSGNTTIGTGFVNFDIVVKPLDCILPPGDQVDLYKNGANFMVMYPCETMDLNSLVKSPWPVGAEIVWKYSPYVNVVSIGDYIVENAGPSAQPYYAFYYHKANDCYTLTGNNKSTATVKITYAPQQVPLSPGSSVNVKCPSSSYSLKTKLVAASDSSRVKWFDNNNHQGSPIPQGKATTPGTYYAFFYSDEFKCYSTNTSTSSITVSFETPCCKAGTNQVTVQPAMISNSCPLSTADLTKTTLNFNVPLNTQLVWFNNPTHTAPKISNPNAVGPGTYYAFIYDPLLQCYNTDNSTAQVKVSINLCAMGPQLNLRVVLQGARMPGSGDDVMHNNLQAYSGSGISGLLPTKSPYGDLATCLDINNTAKMSYVADWVKIEIRDAFDPSLVLESKSVILLSSGLISNLDGTGQPFFTSQSKPVRIAVKHRNHLAVMSNPIQDFSSGMVSYDFTTALSQASNEFGDPPQMVLKNGMWCMWAGDVNSNPDLGIDATDSNEIYKINKQGASYDIYDTTDINMDGGVDANDRNLIYLNNLTGSISTLSNY